MNDNNGRCVFLAMCYLTVWWLYVWLYVWQGVWQYTCMADGHPSSTDRCVRPVSGQTNNQTTPTMNPAWSSIVRCYITA